MSNCDIPACTNKSRSKNIGPCEKHYYRIRRTGTAERKIEPNNICHQCGNKVANNLIFCSGRCNTRNSRGRDENCKICKNCKKEISSKSRKDKVFCSSSCSSIYKYYEFNKKDQFNVYAAQRRARKRGNGGILTLFDWNAILKFYKFTCLCCGDKADLLTKDHIVPLSYGGSHEPSNIQPLCLPCNLKKYTKTIDYRPDRGLELLEYVKLKRGG